MKPEYPYNWESMLYVAIYSVMSVAYTALMLGFSARFISSVVLFEPPGNLEWIAFLLLSYHGISAYQSIQASKNWIENLVVQPPEDGDDEE